MDVSQTNPTDVSLVDSFKMNYLQKCRYQSLLLLIALLTHSGCTKREHLPANARESFDKSGGRKVEYDRNYDGRPDYVEWYTNSILSVVESDDSFTGFSNIKYFYSNGVLRLMVSDIDMNGIGDSFLVYENGIPVASALIPNGKVILRYSEWTNGVPSRTFEDADADGLVDTGESEYPLRYYIERNVLTNKVLMIRIAKQFTNTFNP
jgi:hypothetical protein